MKNGTNIDGAAGSTYTIDHAALANNGAKIAVRVTSSAGTIASLLTMCLPFWRVLPGVKHSPRAEWSSPNLWTKPAWKLLATMALSGGVTIAEAALGTYPARMATTPFS